MTSDMFEKHLKFDIDPNNVTDRFLDMIYSNLVEYRNELGYPVGTNEIPGFVCSNDIFGKFSGFISLCKGKNIPLDNEFICKLTDCLIDTYDDKKDCGCCSFWHSQPKEVAINIKKKFMTAIS